MAGIGEDIKEVLNELGTTALITRVNGSVFQEKADAESFPTHSSEFIRQFFYILTMQYDTAAINGDSISFHGENFILTNLVPSYFEDLAVDQTAALYKCNVTGVLKRYTETTDANFVKKKDWVKVTENPDEIHALQYENKFGMEALFAEDFQNLLKESHVLILPAGLDIAIDDRWYPDSTDETIYYRIDTIETRRLSSCPICSLSEDSR